MHTQPILVFDLDDTLYDEIDYVKSGFHSVSEMLEFRYGLDKRKTFNAFIKILNISGRGSIFDIFLSSIGLYKKSIVQSCIHKYRVHKPKIILKDDVRNLLSDINNNSYLVTDGNKVVQSNKIKALKLKGLFKKIFITHQFGIKYSKPSTYCFEKIVDLEKTDLRNLVYIGDNPNKDFVNLNKAGAQTIRILRGPYKNLNVIEGFDAKIKINTLSELKEIFRESFVK